jgi:hypothetical protein
MVTLSLATLSLAALSLVTLSSAGLSPAALSLSLSLSLPSSLALSSPLALALAWQVPLRTGVLSFVACRAARRRGLSDNRCGAQGGNRERSRRRPEKFPEVHDDVSHYRQAGVGAHNPKLGVGRID